MAREIKTVFQTQSFTAGNGSGVVSAGSLHFGSPFVPNPQQLPAEKAAFAGQFMVGNGFAMPPLDRSMLRGITQRIFNGVKPGNRRRGG